MPGCRSPLPHPLLWGLWEGHVQEGAEAGVLDAVGEAVGGRLAGLVVESSREVLQGRLLQPLQQAPLRPQRPCWPPPSRGSCLRSGLPCLALALSSPGASFSPFSGSLSCYPSCPARAAYRRAVLPVLLLLVLLKVFPPVLPAPRPPSPSSSPHLFVLQGSQHGLAHAECFPVPVRGCTSARPFPLGPSPALTRPRFPELLAV